MIPPRPFTSTFLAWFAAADLHDILRPEPCADRDAVALHFLVGGGALGGWAYPHDLSVGAILRGECWDLLFTDELAAEKSGEGWRCSLCLDDPPKGYSSLEKLRIEHLFAPFARWIRGTLRPAKGISFYGHGGITWAELEEPEDDAVHFQPLNWVDVQSINR